MDSARKMLTVLITTCLCAAVALCLVFVMTKDDIELKQRLKFVRAIKAVLPVEYLSKEVDIINYPLCKEDCKVCNIIYIVKEKSKVVALATEVTVKGYGGRVSVIVGVGEDNKITGLKVVQHSETPGLGANIIKDVFQRQFAGRDETIKLKKDGGNIDHVTGASVSSRAVVKCAKEGLGFIIKNRSIVNYNSG
ncbi:MAG: RnfABCDGE type electron transport complex subunit G [Candidatus Magnetoovum sp. WYHC-5]|nr:RnfABCDGE type electron transport complex subunit G [Candidatus Magnetoovum sp. WYHC-5]